MFIIEQGEKQEKTKSPFRELLVFLTHLYYKQRCLTLGSSVPSFSHLKGIEEIDGDVPYPGQIPLIEGRGRGWSRRHSCLEDKWENELIARSSRLVQYGDSYIDFRPFIHARSSRAERIPLNVSFKTLPVRGLEDNEIGRVVTVTDLIDRGCNFGHLACWVLCLDINLQQSSINSPVNRIGVFNHRRTRSGIYLFPWIHAEIQALIRILEFTEPYVLRGRPFD